MDIATWISKLIYGFLIFDTKLVSKMDDNREHNLNVVRRVINDLAYDNLCRGRKMYLLSEACKKGVNVEDIKLLIKEKEDNQRLERVHDTFDIDMSQINIFGFDDFGKIAGEKAKAMGATFFPNFYQLMWDNMTLFIPLDFAFWTFQQETGVDLTKFSCYHEIIIQILDAHTIDQKDFLQAGQVYKTKYGNSLHFTRTRVKAGNIEANIFFHELSDEQQCWKIYYLDRLLIPNELVNKLKLISVRNPNQRFTYDLDKSLCDMIRPELYGKLIDSGYNNVIDPILYEVNVGKRYSAPSIWVNLKNTTFTDYFVSEGLEYLEMLRETTFIQYTYAKKTFLKLEFAILSEQEQLYAIENFLNEPGMSIDRPSLMRLYDRIKLHNFLNLHIKK